MPFQIIRQDITKINTNIIVNAANTQLLNGGGVCGAIFSAAGEEEMQKACSKIGHCETGNAVMTRGFQLPAKYVIHTVGPIYGQNPDLQEKQLYSCYEQSLKLAKRKRAKSIAFPLISLGIYGYPKIDAMRIATQAISDFLQKNEMDIYLAIYDSDAFEIGKILYDNIESYIDERSVKQRDFGSCAHEVSMAFTTTAVFDYIKERKKDSQDIQDTTKLPQMIYPQSAYRIEQNLDDIINKKRETFSQMLLRKIDEKGMADVEVYKRANIDRKLFSKIRKKDYTPKKITVMALIISLRLSHDEAKDLLARAGYAFSVASKTDLIIEYFIENEIYDIFTINEALFAFEQPLLGV